MIKCGLVGWKNSGKTFLAQKIIKKLTQKSINVASIKRAHHDFDIDAPNTDSYLHRKAGSKQVIVSSSKRWAKITELDNKKEKTLEELLKEFDNTDVVIVEGFKNELHKKIEIINQSNENYLFNKIQNVVLPKVISGHNSLTILGLNYFNVINLTRKNGISQISCSWQ